MATVELDRVSKHFPGPNGSRVDAVRDLSLRVRDGEFVTLVGPSGCGKSTTLRLVAGLEFATTGTLRLDGRDITAAPPQQRGVTMVFQGGALYPHLTVAGNLAFGLRLRRAPRAEVERRVRETADLFGLRDLLDRLPSTLSGGQRQRVALGRAFIREPGVFLLDEPLSDLDAPARAALRHEIGRLRQRVGATFLHVTHDQAEAMALGDRVAVLREGVLQQIASPGELYARPANRFVAGFIGSPPMNLLPARISNAGGTRVLTLPSASGRADAATHALPPGLVAALNTPDGNEIVLGFRPEHARILTDATGAAGLQLVGPLETREPAGAETWLQLTVGGHRLMLRTPGDQAAPLKTMVTFFVPWSRICFFAAPGGALLPLAGGAAACD
ncbi:MAG: ABC transporter ATP-binding protein [Verrucomicrobiales bacterium]|nr:ABC transporter ATP-binding protein [Verrucomicrobiales bacterium]MCP5526655.1 ABC transporter ATP-binding protein [Verrucomicrobiales bacterium]